MTSSIGNRHNGQMGLTLRLRFSAHFRQQSIWAVLPWMNEASLWASKQTTQINSTDFEEFFEESFSSMLVGGRWEVEAATGFVACTRVIRVLHELQGHPLFGPHTPSQPSVYTAGFHQWSINKFNDEGELAIIRTTTSTLVHSPAAVVYHSRW